MTNLEAALQYLALGWSIIPGHSVDGDGICTCTKIDCGRLTGKHPRLNTWTQYQTKLPSEFQVRSWWQRWPDANILVITGTLSGLVVVDQDPRHGGDVTILEYKPLPDTVVCTTGGGGEHYYFKHPNLGYIHSGSNFLPGIDIRADGGYAIAPPSLHASKRQYAWQVGCSPEEQELAPIPPNLLPIILGFKGASNGKVKEYEALELLPYISGERRLHEGERNERLTQFAGQLLGRGDSVEAVIGTLALIAALADPPLEFSEVQTIVRSIHNRELRKQEANKQTQEALNDTELSTMGIEQRIELARAVWRQLGIDNVVDWIQLSGTGEADFQIELPDRIVSVGGALIGGYGKIRDILNTAHAGLIPRMQLSKWDRYAQQLAQLAREETVGALRQSETLEEWIEEYGAGAIDYPLGPRHTALNAARPILYEGKIATRLRSFAVWLERYYGEKFTSHQLGRMLRMASWETRPIPTTEDGKQVRVWIAP